MAGTLSPHIKENDPMKKALLSSLAILFLASGSIAVAQTSTDANPDPKILQVTVEYTKPGKGGAMHDKSESAFMAPWARRMWMPPLSA